MTRPIDSTPEAAVPPVFSSVSDPTSALDAALREHFGHTSFRPGQRGVIEAVVRGRPVLAVMPTGAGKSLCYQLPALLSPGITLVVSPLIALMQDQVDALTARGVAATCINSHVPPPERDRRLAALRRGVYRLVYVAPERLRSSYFLSALRDVKIARMAVDEAHCVSQWGHDFRPDYRELPTAVRALQVSQVCAFTATATPEVQRDIVSLLGLDGAREGVGPEVFVHGFRRENLRLHVVPVARLRDKIAHIVALARAHDGQSGIVYCATRKNVDKVAEALGDEGFSVGRYHGGMGEADRTAAQNAFMNGHGGLMVATNAFGMGIDKAAIRFVAHHDLPGSIEAYYQEAGRAGRDGEVADCAIFFNYADVHVQEFFIEHIGDRRDDRDVPASSPEQIARLQALERSKLRRMINYCYTEGCRQDLLLRYFGERVEGEGCGICDRCAEGLGEPLPAWTEARALSGKVRKKRTKAKDAASSLKLGEEAIPDAESFQFLQKILSAYARSKGRLSRPRIIALLRGTAKELPEDLAASRSAGILADTRAKILSAVIEELLARGALRSSPGGRHVYLLTARGVALLRGENTMALRLPVAATPSGLSRTGRSGSASRVVGVAEAVPLDTEDAALFDALVVWRKDLAGEAKVPAYVIAHDRVLREVATSRPSSETELLAIHGMGPTKVARYGAALLEAVRAHGGTSR